MSENEYNKMHALCPDCEAYIPKFTIKDDTIQIECGFVIKKPIKLKTYLRKYYEDQNRFYTYENKCPIHHEVITAYCECRRCNEELCDKCKFEHEYYLFF